MFESNLFDEFEVIGDWWLPEDGRRVPGTFKYSPSEGGSLSLMGGLGDSSRRDSITGKFVVHGIDRQGTLWSLLDVLELEMVPTSASGRPGSSKVIANFFLSGVHVHAFTELAVATVTVSMPGLDASLQQASNFNFAWDESLEQTTVTWKQPSGRAIRIDSEKATLSSYCGQGSKSSRKQHSMSDEWTLSLKFDASKTFDVVQPLIWHLRNLFITLHGLACPLLKIYVRPSHEPGTHPVQVFIRQSCDLDFPKEPNWPELLVPVFRLSEAEFEAVVCEWFNLSADARFAIGWHCGMVLAPISYNHIELANLVQALESLHRAGEKAKFCDKAAFKLAKDALFKTLKDLQLSEEQTDVFASAINHASPYSLRQRISALYDNLPETLRLHIASDPAKFSHALVKTRDFTAHLDPGSEAKGMARTDILFANLGLKLFFWLVVLIKLGVKPEIINEGLKHRHDFIAFRRFVPWDKVPGSPEESLGEDREQ